MPLTVEMENSDVGPPGDYILDNILQLPLIQAVGEFRLILVPSHDSDKALHHMGELCHGHCQGLCLLHLL